LGPRPAIWRARPGTSPSSDAPWKRSGQLAVEKRYELVYLDSSGTNAFLVALEHAAELGSLPTLQYRSPNYHLSPNGRHPGTLDETRFVDLRRDAPQREKD
jgi:hypothetical protein